MLSVPRCRWCLMRVRNPSRVLPRFRRGAGLQARWSDERRARRRSG